MTEPVQVVGRVGVAPLHLIGGPLDGIVKWGVVGSALTIRLKKPKAAPKADYRAAMSWFFNGPTAIDGEGWKEMGEDGVTRHYQHHAVYIPVIGLDRKATDRVMFEGIFAVEIQPPAKPEPKPVEYEAAEDEDDDE